MYVRNKAIISPSPSNNRATIPLAIPKNIAKKVNGIPTKQRIEAVLSADLKVTLPFVALPRPSNTPINAADKNSEQKNGNKKVTAK